MPKATVIGPNGDFQATARPAEARRARLSLMQLAKVQPGRAASRWPTVPISVNSAVSTPYDSGRKDGSLSWPLPITKTLPPTAPLLPDMLVLCGLFLVWVLSRLV